MPPDRAATRAAAAGKQRVRTGCLTCRKRRRKCDERKPRCENCEAKGFTCEYRIDLEFVQSSNAASLTSNGMSQIAVQSYSSIKFIINETANASTSRHHIATSEVRHDDNPLGNLAAASSFNYSPSSIQRTNQVSPLGFSSRPIQNMTYPRTTSEITLLDSMNGSTNALRNVIRRKSTLEHTRVAESLVSNNYPPVEQEASIICHETSLLRHYRYKVAPWIDIGDPASPFGTKVLLEAKGYQPLFEAILALAACHRSLIFPRSSNFLENTPIPGQESEEEPPANKHDVDRVRSVLLMLRDFFPSSPRLWRDLLSHHLRSSGDFLGNINLKTHLGAPLLWLYFRIDLAASIIRSQAPLLPFLSFLRHDGSLISEYQPLSHLKSPKQAFQHALLLLATSLSLIFGMTESSDSHNEGLNETTFSSMQNLASTGWTAIWNNCIEWYSDQPVELQPIVDVRGMEVDEVDMQSASSFPILIYTTPLALVANAIYHITSLLLLKHRPRLLRAIPGSRSFLSPMWHMHSIAGIAIADDSPEQWDPILVAGLLLVARDLTHEAQQETVLERLGIIRASTGMNLTDEIETLRNSWSIASYHDEMIT